MLAFVARIWHRYLVAGDDKNDKTQLVGLSGTIRPSWCVPRLSWVGTQGTIKPSEWVQVR